jgi:zinc transport system substrate-binding protein
MMNLRKTVLAFFLAGISIAAFAQAEAKEITAVASFYPAYITALNVTKGVPEVKVVNLTSGAQGCLHDYALTTNDMRALSQADIFVVNGAGTEGFLEQVARQYPKLKIVRLADGVPLIENNPHVWLSISGAVVGTKNLGRAMQELDPEHAGLYQKNTDEYVLKLEKLGLESYSRLAAYKGAKIITLHDGFVYFASEFGLEIVAVIESEDGAQPSAQELAQVIEVVKKYGVKAIFSDQRALAPALQTVTFETGVSNYVLDLAVSGPDDPDAYIRIMQKNAQTVTEALK